MDDKQIKIMRLKEKNKSAKLGQVVFAGSSLMEMFPIDKLLSEHGDDTVIYNTGIGGFTSEELFMNVNTCITDLKPSKLFQ